MRKLIYSINLTIDGCCDHTAVNPSEEMLFWWGELVKNAGAFVYGRVTYELMVPFWPDIARSQSGLSPAANAYGKAFETVDKLIVFSKTLAQPEGNRTTVFRGNLKEEILKLKQEPGKDLYAGGVDLGSQLIDLDLVDEYYFVVHPVIAGKGRRLMDVIAHPEKLSLKLVDSQVLPTGQIANHYIRA